MQAGMNDQRESLFFLDLITPSSLHDRSGQLL
nr:MAG TPA: hypothetical protein [Caudoviricetes sp.]